MKVELNQYLGKGLSNDNQRRLLLDDLEEKLLKTEKKAGQFEIEYQKSIKKIELIKAGIESIFTTLECDSEDFEELIGAHGITESNMLVYLGIIEQKINEIIQAYAFIKTEKAKHTGDDINSKEDPYLASLQNMLAIGPNQEPTYGRIRVEVPSFHDELSDDGLSDGTNDKPLKFEEFQQRAEIMTKQDNKSKKKAKPIASIKK